MIGPFYVGQKPGFPLVVTVRDIVTDEPKNLSNYTSVEFKIVDPEGADVDTSAGTASISDATGGKVTYVWPNASLFAQEGDYKLQVKLIGANSEDYTGTTTFEVYETI